MEHFKKLLALVPKAPDWQIQWELLKDTPLSGMIRDMRKTPQNPAFHGEGDVWTHTKLVCQALSGMDAFRALTESQRQPLFLAALLHDIGKTVCTRMEDGCWTSPNHAAVGAGMVRRLLWVDFGLSGTVELQHFRETVCAFVRYHSTPAYVITDPDGKRRLHRIAANGELLPKFSLELLCMLAQADALGRICADREDMLERTELAKELAIEANCYRKYFDFASNYSRFCYFNGKNIQPEQHLHDDTWGEVILLSGLPGTGKDTWIRENFPDMPQISLDEIRLELKIPPTANQSKVIETARQRAKELLRRKQPFIWNATDLSPMIRRRQIDLFTDYHARTRIIFLETGWEEQLRRNRNRPSAVPEQAICRMMDHLVLPEVYEAYRVEWICV